MLFYISLIYFAYYRPADDDQVFSIYGNSKNRKKPATAANASTSALTPATNNTTTAAVTNVPAILSVTERANNPTYSCDLTAAYFRAETARKYMAQFHEPRAPPCSVETGIDINVPRSSPLSSDVTIPGIDVLRQVSLCSGSSDYELHELDNMVNSLKNVV